MLYLINKNKKKRFFFFKVEKYQLILKSLINNKNIITPYSHFFNRKIKLLFSKSSYKTKISNRCVITGRKNILLKQFRMSRLTLPFFISNNKIPGFTRLGW